MSHPKEACWESRVERAPQRSAFRGVATRIRGLCAGVKRRHPIRSSIKGASLAPESRGRSIVPGARRPGGEVTATTPNTGTGGGVWASLGVLDAETEVIRCIINRLR